MAVSIFFNIYDIHNSRALIKYLLKTFISDNSSTNHLMKHATKKIFQLMRYFLSLIMIVGISLCYDVFF